MLYADPRMEDSYFKRTAVLICSYSKSEGALGFIVNRPIALRVNEVLPTESHIARTLNFGGPVADDQLFFLHTLTDMQPDTLRVQGPVHWGGDFDVLSGLIRQGRAPESSVSFFVGYSGWSPGQLEEELTSGAWLSDYPNADVFWPRVGRERLWKNKMNAQGGNYAVWANFPEFSSQN
ncbi:MAG: YqgE/AlgH family protein [Bacteroidia bacterium]|jgi:putative transcriptional regulator